MPRLTMRDGHQVYVRDIGKGRPIVLLHGFGMQSSHWLPFVLPLASKYRFILPDFRGFGLSHQTTYNQDCVLTNYAEDLDDILSALAIDNFKLAGISMGALAALQYQKDFGSEKIEHYLHIDQSPKCTNSKKWNWGLFGTENDARLKRAKSLIKELNPYIENESEYAAIPAALKNRLWSELGDFFASALSKPSHKKLAKRICAREFLVRRILPTDNWAAYIFCLQSYIDQKYDMTSVFRNMSIPLSIIVGLKSEMYPCGGQLRIADYAKHGKIIPFKHSGHTPLIDQPIQFFKALGLFAAS